MKCELALMVRDWKTIATKQMILPGTRELIVQLTTRLKNEFAAFGPELEVRLESCALFGATTFPQEQRTRFAYDEAYIIAWVFAMDYMLDTIPSFDYAQDFQSLLNRRVELPVAGVLTWNDLALAHDPTISLPGLSYSILTLVEALQPLRQSLANRMPDAEGLIIFDRCLTQNSAPAMIQETSWRLRLEPMPEFNEYIANAQRSMCGNLCTAVVNAALPDAENNWNKVNRVMQTMCHAIRLINDDATWPREQEEGKPNGLGINIALYGEAEGRQATRQIINDYSAEVELRCRPYIQTSSTEHPLYILNYYIYHVLVMTEAMYARGDFVWPYD